MPSPFRLRLLPALAALALVAAALGGQAPQPAAQPAALTVVGSDEAPQPGDPISLRLAPLPPFAPVTQPGSRVWSLTYWSRGLRCQAYLAVPGGKGPYPLLVELHGGFATGLPYHESAVGTSAAQAEQASSLPAVVLLPNYGGYGPSQGIVGDTQDDLIDTVAALKALGQIRGLRVQRADTYLAGSSLGGAIALMLAAQDRAVRAAIIVSPWPGARLAAQWYTTQVGHLTRDDLDGYGELLAYGSDLSTPWYRGNSPVLSRIAVPVLIIAGTWDPIVPPGMVRSLYRALRRHDRSVALRFFPGGHGPRGQAVSTAEATFLTRHGLPLAP